jgi:short-subunit dehydrogenase
VTAEACRAKGAVTKDLCFDLREVDRLGERLRGLDRDLPFDLAIFNAGVGGAPGGAIVEPAEHVHDVAMVNFTAAVVGATVVAEGMVQRGRGHIVLVGSIAESFPLPQAPAYAGAKAGLRRFAEALDIRLSRHGVAVSLVSPGFIDTPMSRGLAVPKPLMLTADAAAAAIKRKLAARPRRIVVPRSFAVMRALAALLPRPILRAILTRY